MVVKTN